MVYWTYSMDTSKVLLILLKLLVKRLDGKQFQMVSYLGIIVTVILRAVYCVKILCRLPGRLKPIDLPPTELIRMTSMCPVYLPLGFGGLINDTHFLTPGF